MLNNTTTLQLEIGIAPTKSLKGSFLDNQDHINNINHENEKYFKGPEIYQNEISSTRSSKLFLNYSLASPLSRKASLIANTTPQQQQQQQQQNTPRGPIGDVWEYKKEIMKLQGFEKEKEKISLELENKGEESLGLKEHKKRRLNILEKLIEEQKKNIQAKFSINIEGLIYSEILQNLELTPNRGDSSPSQEQENLKKSTEQSNELTRLSLEANANHQQPNQLENSLSNAGDKIDTFQPDERSFYESESSNNNQNQQQKQQPLHKLDQNSIFGNKNIEKIFHMNNDYGNNLILSYNNLENSIRENEPFSGKFGSAVSSIIKDDEQSLMNNDDIKSLQPGISINNNNNNNQAAQINLNSNTGANDYGNTNVNGHSNANTNAHSNASSISYSNINTNCNSNNVNQSQSQPSSNKKNISSHPGNIFISQENQNMNGSFHYNTVENWDGHNMSFHEFNQHMNDPSSAPATVNNNTNTTSLNNNNNNNGMINHINMNLNTNMNMNNNMVDYSQHQQQQQQQQQQHYGGMALQYAKNNINNTAAHGANYEIFQGKYLNYNYHHQRPNYYQHHHHLRDKAYHYSYSIQRYDEKSNNNNSYNGSNPHDINSSYDNPSLCNNAKKQSHYASPQNHEFEYDILNNKLDNNHRFINSNTNSNVINSPYGYDQDSGLRSDRYAKSPRNQPLQEININRDLHSHNPNLSLSMSHRTIQEKNYNPNMNPINSISSILKKRPLMQSSHTMNTLGNESQLDKLDQKSPSRDYSLDGLTPQKSQNNKDRDVNLKVKELTEKIDFYERLFQDVIEQNTDNRNKIDNYENLIQQMKISYENEIHELREQNEQLLEYISTLKAQHLEEMEIMFRKNNELLKVKLSNINHEITKPKFNNISGTPKHISNHYGQPFDINNSSNNSSISLLSLNNTLNSRENIQANLDKKSSGASSRRSITPLGCNKNINTKAIYDKIKKICY